MKPTYGIFRRMGLVWAISLLLVSLFLRAGVANASPWAWLVDKYCAGCHSSSVRSGGLILEPAALDRVAQNAGQWENVIRKLRAGAMPPLGAPR